MSETKNYGLYLEGDSSVRFKEWREKINGLVNSNIEKIDTVLAQKAEASRDIDIMLNTSLWFGSSKPFAQELNIENLSTEQNGIIDVAHNITDEQFQAACDAMLCIGEQADGKLVILAKGAKPSCDIPITLILFG